MQFDYLETARLKLRKVDNEIYRHVFTCYNNDELKAFFGFDSDQSLEAERQKFNGGLTTYNRSFMQFQLIEKQTGKIIGSCGFHGWAPLHSRAEIGYMISEVDYRKKGYMSEAVSAIIDYGFQKMGLFRIEALADPENRDSLNIIENHKFKKEGLLRKHYNVNGELLDSVMYALLKDEYYGY